MQGLDPIRDFHIVFHTVLGILDVLQGLPQGNKRTIERINSRCSRNWPMHHLLPKLSKTCWLMPSVAKWTLVMTASLVTYLLWLSLAGQLTVSGSIGFCSQTSQFQLYLLFLLYSFNYILYKPMKYHKMRILFFYEYCKECFGKT